MFTWLKGQGVGGALSAVLMATLLSFTAMPASAQAMSEALSVWEAQVRAEIAQQREVAAALDRESDPVAWAVAQTELANMLDRLRDHASITESITLYRAALEILTPETTPAEWLVAQEGLGDVLLTIGASQSMASAFGMRFGGSEFAPSVSSRDAAEAFRTALNFRTRERDRAAWARLQIKLGSALTLWTASQRFSQAETAETDAIQNEAESAFRRALSALSLRANPLEWALANEGLAILYSQAAMFIGHEYVEDEAALRRSEVRRVRHLRAAMAATREAERAYRRSGDKERTQDMRQRLERLREDLRPNRRVPDW